MKTSRPKGLQLKPYPPFVNTFMGFAYDEHVAKEQRAEKEKRYHEHQRLIQKREFDALVGNLSETISKLNQSLMPHHSQWPTDETLSAVTRQVEEICPYLGRQDTRFFWENCAFVEDRKSKLRVRKCISNLVDRALATDERPLNKFLEAAGREHGTSEIAKAFIGILPKLAARTVNVADEDWQKFSPLFTKCGSPVIDTNLKGAAASESFRCYTKCLEVLLDDLDWRRRHAKGSMVMLSWVSTNFPKAHPIFQKLQRFAVFPGSPSYEIPSSIDHIHEHEEKIKQLKVRNRKRAERARKLGKTA